MDSLPDPTLACLAPTFSRFACDAHGAWFRPKMWLTVLLMAISFTALSAPHSPSSVFGGVLHAHGPHGVYTEIRFEPHHLIARVHEPHICVLRAHLVHGDPHTSRYAIEPPQGGRFCDELVDGEIVIHPHSPNDVIAEFRSPRMNWSGRFRRHTAAH
ncbi:MAG TPA: hypothetical protein VL997_15500 [Dyella sp.]|nr:hypothetical protein [Dyella sp.]